MSIRRFCFSAIAAALTTFYAASSWALVNDCTNDVDCTGGGAACGGDVCQWDAEGNHTCVPAGTDGVGKDGWCTIDTDCKCMAEGATCTGIHCSFTEAGAASGGTGGGSGTAGSASAGTTATSSDESSDDGGGCSISGVATNTGGALAAFATAGAFTLLLRRRRH